MAHIENSGYRQSNTPPRENGVNKAQSEFTPEQAIEIFNAITSQDPNVKEDILNSIQDNKLKEIAVLAIEGSDKNDPNQSERIIIDFQNLKTPLPWYS